MLRLMDAEYPMGIASLTMVKTLLIWRGKSPLSQVWQAVNTQFPNEFVGLFGSLEAAARWPVRRIMSLGQSAKFLMRMFPDRFAAASMYIPASTHQTRDHGDRRRGGVGGGAWFEVELGFETLRSSLSSSDWAGFATCNSPTSDLLSLCVVGFYAGYNAKCSL